MRHFGPLVYRHEACLESVAEWDAGDKVHCDVFPGLVGDGQGPEDTVGCVTGCFETGSNVGVADILVHVAPHHWRLVGVGHEFEGFRVSEVSSGGEVKVFSHEPELEAGSV